MASVGVWTRPSETAPSNEDRSRIVAARVAFMPTIQSASERDFAAASRDCMSSSSRRCASASRIASFVIEESHSRLIGAVVRRRPPAASSTYLKISSPSRPASQALTTRSRSSRPRSWRRTDICFWERSSRTTSRKLEGTIGRSAMRHFLYLSSYSSGSASWTRWPTAHEMRCSGPSSQRAVFSPPPPVCFSNGPGSTRARSCPTEGFSAMTSALPMGGSQ